MARRRPAEPTANPARGAALVVVAVVIGLFLLREGLDSSEAVTADPSDQGSDSSDSGEDSDGSDEGDEGTTTTTVATRPPGEVPTIVLNDSGIAGAAGTYSDALLAVGYQLTNPDGANADAEGNAATTIVHFAPGFEAEAAAVAAAIGAPDLAPTALPTTPPGPIAGASVVVVLGTDLAGVTPTTAAPADTTTTAAQ
jgi:LytR cell envelope-related transcriptional attenuator